MCCGMEYSMQFLEQEKKEYFVEIMYNLYVNKRIIYGALIPNPNANKTNMRFVNTSGLPLLL